MRLLRQRSCDDFETALLVESVMLRSAGRDFRDPPEDIAPDELWDEAVRLFPHALQREFSDPQRKEESGHDEESVSLTSEVALSEDSGISLSAVRTLTFDMSGDGNAGTEQQVLDYTLWVDNKSWSGATINTLRGHLHQFQVTLRARDPDGLAKFVGKP